MRSRRSSAIFIVALPLLVLTTACGSLYKVKPVVEAPLPEAARVAEAGGIRLRAVPLITDEESQELFEANLPLAGLLPVRVEITNTTGAMVEIKQARFRLRDVEGREWKSRSVKDAVSRILKDNDITLYNPQVRARFEEAVRAYALDTKRPLAASERRQGLIFFQTPKKEAVSNPRALVLSIEKLSQPLEVQLN
jgi:hypothetical protein